MYDGCKNRAKAFENKLIKLQHKKITQRAQKNCGFIFT